MHGTVADLFRWINNRYGLNFSPFTDAFDGQRFLLGLRTTIELSLTCILFSVVLGVLGAWLLSTRSRLARGAVRCYVQAFRNTPPLVQLAFFYFAVGSLLHSASGAQEARR
jgi:polar amino acid transport system permease protein